MHKAALSKSRLHIYEMHISVTKNYMKLIVNKLCFIMWLPDGCVLSKVEGKAVNTNWEPAGQLQQLKRSTLYVWVQYCV